MHESGFFDGMTRRESLAGASVAGLGALFAGKGAGAETGRITRSRFGYRFRTFGPEEPIRVGMIGNVGHVSTVLGALPALKNVSLAACSNKTNKNLKLPAGVRIYDEYPEMLDSEKLDVVGVCLPYSLNAGASIAAAERGCHIITEKPVATTLGDLARLLDTVAANRVRLTAMLSMRMEPVFQAVHRAIGEGKIGEPILATGQKSYKFGKSRPDFYKVEETYGGTIPWVGIHALDYIHFTTRLDFTDVFAYQGNRDHPDYPGFQDFAGVILRLSNGGAAMINIDYLRPETSPTHGDDRLRVIGSEGVIEIKDLASRVELITQENDPVDLELPEGRSFFADFIAELRGQGTHILTPEEPFEMTRVALLAHQAAKNREVISL